MSRAGKADAVWRYLKNTPISNTNPQTGISVYAYLQLRGKKGNKKEKQTFKSVKKLSGRFYKEIEGALYRQARQIKQKEEKI